MNFLLCLEGGRSGWEETAGIVWHQYCTSCGFRCSSWLQQKFDYFSFKWHCRDALVISHRVALIVPACQPGWEEKENLRGNLRKFERKYFRMKSSWEEAPKLKSPWSLTGPAFSHSYEVPPLFNGFFQAAGIWYWRKCYLHHIYRSQLSKRLLLWSLLSNTDSVPSPHW